MSLLSCFNLTEIKPIAHGINDLLKQVSENPNCKCKDYNVDVIDFFKAENYYNNLINSFDSSTIILSDINNVNKNYKLLSKKIDTSKLGEISDKYGVSIDRFLLSVFMFNLTKFSFSKDILIAYNKLACGYHFNTDFTVEEYVIDFNKNFKEYYNYPLLNNQNLNFESDVLFFTDSFSSENSYNFMFNYESGSVNLNYNVACFSEELMKDFLDSFVVLIDKFALGDVLLNSILI